jgi:hypothetical protein
MRASFPAENSYVEAHDLRGNSRSSIRWRVVLDSGLTLAVIFLLAVFTIVQDAGRLHLVSSADEIWGADFHGGLWPAAAAILRGSSPYPPARLHILLGLPHAFFWPPVMAVLTVPLAHVPYGPAVAVWDVICISSFVGGIWLFGVRDWRMYALALLSFPFQESLYMGQAESIHFLFLALAWRHRESWRGGVAAGALIAAKIIAWPIFLWLIVSRRYDAAKAAVATTIVLLVGSWSLIDFRGLLTYPHLLSLDGHIWELSPNSMSAVSVLIHAGLSATTSTVASVVIGLLVGAAAVRVSRGSEEGSFSAAILASLLWSPLMWTHYVLIIFAPLCVARRQGRSLWLLTALFWVWIASHNYDVRAIVTLATVIVLTVLAARPPGRIRARRTD